MSNTDEIGSPNKVGKWVMIFMLFIGLPTLLLTEWSLEKFQTVVNDNAEKPWSADLQKWIAHSYAYTMRPQKAAEKYEWAARQYVRFEMWEPAGWMLYSQGREYEESPQSNDKYKALEVYERVAEQYKEYPVGGKAHNAVVRIKTMSRT